jgi:hypothetical protein
MLKLCNDWTAEVPSSFRWNMKQDMISINVLQSTQKLKLEHHVDIHALLPPCHGKTRVSQDQTRVSCWEPHFPLLTTMSSQSSHTFVLAVFVPD